MGPSPTNVPGSHPSGKRHQRNLHYDLAATHPPLIPKRKKRIVPPSRLRPDLCREKIYPQNSFRQALLQGHILAILYLDAPTGLLPLLTSPSSVGPANAHHQAMRIQLILLMEQDRLSKEEAGELLDQRVHVLASTQDLRHLMRNFVKLAGYYLGEEIPILLSMGTWPRHIDRFERQGKASSLRGGYDG